MHDLRDFLRIGRGRRHQREARVRHAGLGEQRLGARDIALGDRNVSGVVRIRRCDPLIADGGLAVHRDLHDAVAVERELEGLAHARVLAERVLLRELAFAHVDGDSVIADFGDLGDLEPAVGIERRDVGGGHALDHVELPGAQVGEAHRRVDDGKIGDLVEVDLALVPVVGVALEDDTILRDSLDKTERSRAHGLGAELVALGLRRFRRDHHSGAIGKRRQQRRERRRQIELHGRFVDDIDGGDRCKLAAAIGAGHGLVTLDVELGRCRVQLFAIVKSHPLA